MFSLVLKLFTNIARVLFANADIPDIIYPLPCVPVEGLVEQTTFYDFIIYYLIFTMIFGLKFHGVRTVVAGSVRRSDSGMAAVIADEPATTKCELVDKPADAQTDLVGEPNIAQTDLVDKPADAQTDLVGKPADAQTDFVDEPADAQTYLAEEPAIAQADLADKPADAQAELVGKPADAQTDLADEPNIAQTNLVVEPANAQVDLVDEPNIAQAEFIIVDSELQRDPCTITNLAREIAATQAELIALDCESQSNSEATVVNDEELADTLVEPKEKSGIENIIAKLMADVSARHARVQAERATKLQAVRAESKRFRENRLLLENSKNLAVAAVQRDAHLHAEPSHSAPALQKPAQDGDVPPTV
ncbi:hypothetical protein IW139_003907 [Coemansia sp. RSA 353]|nr:hypothetical protein IW139_003907 [Coemansia sp. RSA 353]